MKKQRQLNWCKRCQKYPTEKCVAQHPNRIGYSTPYRRGRGFEYRIMAALKKRGCYVFRRYGSKGAFDIGAIPPLAAIDWRTLLIQAKRSRSKIDDHELAHLVIVGQDLAARLFVVTRDERNKLLFKEILINRQDHTNNLGDF